MSVLFCPYWGRNEFSQQIGLCQFLVFTIIMQKKTKVMGDYREKLLTDKQANWQKSVISWDPLFMGIQL